MKKNVLKVFMSALIVMTAIVNTGCSNETGLANDAQHLVAAQELLVVVADERAGQQV